MNEQQAMTLEAGKYYRTRDGKKAFVDAVVGKSPFSDDTHSYPIRGYVEAWGAVSWTVDGREYDETGGDSGRDLVAEWVEPKRIKGKMFICRSVTGVFGSYIADEPKDPLGANIIACVEIDVLEGHGLQGEAA